MTDGDNLIGTMGGLIGTGLVAGAGLGLLNMVNNEYSSINKKKRKRRKK